MTAPQPAVTITLLDVYTKQIELAASLSLIQEQLKAIPDHENRLRVVEGEMPRELEARLMALETARAKLLGAAVAISLAVSGLGTWVGIILTHH